MPETDPGYLRLIAHYENCLDRHGDTHLGVDWPNAEDARTRYGVMLDIIAETDHKPVSLLDFGCGAAHLLGHIRATGRTDIDYRGLDASARFIALCRRKFPDTPFQCVDILREPTDLEPADYVVLNGVFTEKREIGDSAMRQFMETLLTTVWPLARKGIAFNVMSCQVDWKREDLFHVPFDAMADFVAGNLSRHFRFRQDYGLYEYTTYVYKAPRR